MAESPADGSTPIADSPKQNFAWSNMFVHPDDDPRSDGNRYDERTILVEYLRDQRLTLELKCADLDAEVPARRSVPPSKLSLLGLVRHLAEVERGWFRRTMAGQDAPRIYCTKADPDGDFDGAVGDPEVVAEAWRPWRAEVEFAERFVAESDLGSWVGTATGEVSLREVAGAHDRGVRPAQRPRRPDPRADRRPRRPVGAPPSTVTGVL